jgi:NAD(P)-dependent dehydrogenase (short-subunit alcohol dehydrogenase family)
MTDAPGVAGLLDLSGRVAIVTGASGGIGGGIARRPAEAGAAEHELPAGVAAGREAD